MNGGGGGDHTRMQCTEGEMFKFTEHQENENNIFMRFHSRTSAIDEDLQALEENLSNEKKHRKSASEDSRN